MRTEKTSSKLAAPAVLQRERMRGYRQRMKDAGMRQISLWVPDVNSPVMRDEARRQALAASAAPGDAETLAFIESAADFSDWS